MNTAPDTTYHHEIRVTWGDCDPAQIVYTARIPWFALDAINAWWEDTLGDGWFQLELDRGVGTPFVHMSLDFIAPITPRHRLICKVWPARLGKTSIDFRVDGMQGDTQCFLRVYRGGYLYKTRATAGHPGSCRGAYTSECRKTQPIAMIAAARRCFTVEAV
jgi:4-hydroxybenzoyl-CoA thioesterase